jgi:aspartyl aminopeptidase
VGCPQLAMHSIREVGGIHDVGYAVDLFNAFFNEFAALDKRIQVD